MQYLTAICLISILLEGLSPTLAAESTKPYCYKNITETSQKVVIKTRLKTVNKKGLFNKLAQKKETQVEVYEDYEPVYKIKVERVCCEGYKLTELEMCEPQCIENGCPLHSKCVEPEICECMAGYFSTRSPIDNRHYCEPLCEKTCPEHSVCVAPNECACKKGFKVTNSRICEPYCASGCPKGSKCVAPNKCQCPEGFKPEQGLCLAVCSWGHPCENGNCLSDDLCRCNASFSWNYQTLKCEISPSPVDENVSETTNLPTDVTLAAEKSAFDMDLETPTDSYSDDIDPSQVFDEFISSSTSENEQDFSTLSTVLKRHKCPEDFVYHKGECKALKFASNEIDCRLKPCQDKHSVCLENGTCACNEGYQWFKMYVVDQNTLNQTIKTMCLTTAEYEAQQQWEDQQEQIEAYVDWATIIFIALGALVMVSALVYLSWRLVRNQTGQLDVEGKTLACTYDHRAGNESEKSVI